MIQLQVRQMKYMKNRFLFILFVSTILVLVILNITTIINNGKYFSVYGTNYTYSYLLNEEDSINIPILVKDPIVKYLDLNNINSAYIENNEILLPIDINSITNHEKIYYINELEYQLYLINLKLLISDGFKYNITDADIILNYENGEIMTIPVGNINIINDTLIQNDLNNIHITKLHGVINEVNNINSVVGIFLEIENISDYSLYINEININGNPIYSSNNEIVINPDFEITFDTSITDIITDYEVIDDYLISDNIINLETESKTTIFIPLKYTQTSYLYRTILEIKYTYLGSFETYYFDDFIFYDRDYIPLDTIELLEVAIID